MQKTKDINNGHTLTSIFILFPLFGVSYYSYRNCGFINSFIADPEKSYNNDSILIYTVFKPKEEQFDYLSRLTNEMMDLELVADVYDRGEYVILVMILDEKFRKDYENFLKGEYSKFSQLYRDTCPKLGRLEKVVNGHLEYEGYQASQLRIANKDEEWRRFVEDFYDIELPEDGEVHEKPNLTKETINWNNI